MPVKYDVCIQNLVNEVKKGREGWMEGEKKKAGMSRRKRGEDG